MGTPEKLAPVLLVAGAMILVARRRRRRGRPQRLALPATTPPRAEDAPVALAPDASPPLVEDAPVALAPDASPPLVEDAPVALAPDARPPAEPVPDSALPPDPLARDASRTRDLALGYVSIPAVDDRHREDLRRQVKHIRRACDALELSLVDLIPDTESDDVPPPERPGVRRILRRLTRGDASCLVTTTVERLACSAEDWSTLLHRLDAHGIRLVVVDDALDTGLDGGREEAWALVGRMAPGRSR